MVTKLLPEVCLMVSCLVWGGSWPVAAQRPATGITIELHDHMLAEAFAQIQQRTAFRFTYSSQALPATRLRRTFVDQPVEAILDELLRDTGLSYAIRGERIIIFATGEDGSAPAPPARLTLSGYVQDARTGEELAGGSVFIPDTPLGATTNTYGFYSLSLPPGRYRIRIQYLGYEPCDTLLDLDRDRRVDPRLKASAYQLRPVVLQTGAGDDLAREDTPGAQAIGVDLINETPGIFGEQDILLSLQMLPGVLPAGEALGAISVRGGAADQNLVLLDEAPVYFDSHMQGLFSAINTDAVKYVRLYKDHIPAAYRGRLSSVVDIRLDEGSRERFAISAGIGLLTARLKVEGPLSRGKSSFMLAGRRSHFDLLLGRLNPRLADFNVNNLYAFGDWNGKVNLRLGAKDRLFVSGYLGNDFSRIDLLNPHEAGWKNRTATLRWNHLFSDRLFANTTLTFSDHRYTSDQAYTFGAGLFAVSGSRILRSRLRDLQGKVDLQYYPHPRSTLTAGLSVLSHDFSHLPEWDAQAGIDIRDGDLRQRALEAGGYAGHRWTMAGGMVLDYGVHLTFFSRLGAGNHLYTYDRFGERIDSAFYRAGEVVRAHFQAEPRLSLSYTWSSGRRLEATYNRTFQNLYRIGNASAGDPTNLWLIGGRPAPPPRADHWSLAFRQPFAHDAFEISVSLFHKTIRRQVSLRGNVPLAGRLSDVEAQLTTGDVRGRGAEVFLHKRKGVMRGWISYTYSSVRAHFDAIDPVPFPADVDRPHHLSWVGIWDINPKMTLNARWTYTSGKAVTLPQGVYVIDGEQLIAFSRRNAFRLPENHRLDLAITIYRRGIRDRGSSLHLSVMNAYARRNASFVYTQRDAAKNRIRVYRVLTVPTLIPSLTYNFRF